MQRRKISRNLKLFLLLFLFIFISNFFFSFSPRSWCFFFSQTIDIIYNSCRAPFHPLSPILTHITIALQAMINKLHVYLLCDKNVKVAFILIFFFFCEKEKRTGERTKRNWLVRERSHSIQISSVLVRFYMFHSTS